MEKDFKKLPEQKQALAKELKKNVDRLRFVIDAMPQKVWTAKPDGSLDYLNKKWLDYTGLSHDELTAWNWEKIIHPDDLKENLDIWSYSIKTGKDFQFEHRFKRYDGEYRWHLTRGLAQKDEQGNILMWIGTNTDIHDLRIAQDRAIHYAEQLNREIAERERVTEQLKKTNRNLNDFAHIVSHDLKAPLRGISALSDWILSDEKNKLSEASLQNLQLLSGRVKSMSEMIGDILSYARAGKEILPKEKVNVVKLIDEVLKAIDPPPGTVVETCPETPVVAYPKTQLKQVFQNLIDNAIKYSNKPECKVEIACDDEGDHWKFRIKDNGPGIPKKYQKDVFKMFATVPFTSKGGESTGVGLAVVSKVIESNGGSIWVESEPGKGSTFYFTLPK